MTTRPRQPAPVPPQPQPPTIEELRAGAAQAEATYQVSREQADLQNARWIAASRDPNLPPMDETVEGGAYLVSGRWVNANGEFISAPELSADGRPIAPGRKE